MAALLHDYYDDKLVASPETAKQKLNEFLQSQSLGPERFDIYLKSLIPSLFVVERKTININRG